MYFLKLNLNNFFEKRMSKQNASTKNNPVKRKNILPGSITFFFLFVNGSFISILFTSLLVFSCVALFITCGAIFAS